MDQGRLSRSEGFNESSERRHAMAKDPGFGNRVLATVIATEGHCNAGHQVGEQFDLSCHNPAGLCGFFYYQLFPSLQTFQFGGALPWWNGDTIEAGCPDAANQVTLRLVRQPRS
jgi:uncharacterized repeat protein (TIGR04076 family)